MNKLGVFHFFTIILPAYILILASSFLLGIKMPYNAQEDKLVIFAVLYPFALFLGAVITRMGYWMEAQIDKISGKPHPIVQIFKDYPEVKNKLKSLFNFNNLNEEDSIEMDNLFEKGRILIYQQTYSDRIKNKGMLATFFRNLIPISIIVLLIFLYSCIDGPFRYIHYCVKITIPLLIIGVIVYARLLSQSEFKNWMKDILKNLEVYFLTKNDSTNS